jgi:(2Fe-2S) ferredoxin
MSEETSQFRIYCCGNVNCLSRGADDIWKALEDQIWLGKLKSRVELRRSGCQDHCDFGPNMQIWPGPYRYVQLTPAKIKQIVRQHLLGGQPVEEYLASPNMRRQTRKEP